MKLQTVGVRGHPKDFPSPAPGVWANEITCRGRNSPQIPEQPTHHHCPVVSPHCASRETQLHGLRSCVCQGMCPRGEPAGRLTFVHNLISKACNTLLVTVIASMGGFKGIRRFLGGMNSARIIRRASRSDTDLCV